jgi:ketosteroid isomerase-like protein
MADGVADELAIRRALATYSQRLDDGDFAGLAALFTSDGTFDYSGQGTTGRAQLEHWFATMNPPERLGKHLTLNVVVDVDGDHASVSSDFLFLRLADGSITPAITGRYRDDFVRTDGRWLLRSRVVQPRRVT